MNHCGWQANVRVLNKLKVTDEHAKGRGVKTTADIKKGEKIVYQLYQGAPLIKKEERAITPAERVYAWPCDDEKWVVVPKLKADGLPAIEDILWMINEGEDVHAIVDWEGGYLVLEFIQNVPAGIFVNTYYGIEYERKGKGYTVEHDRLQAQIVTYLHDRDAESPPIESGEAEAAAAAAAACDEAAVVATPSRGADGPMPAPVTIQRQTTYGQPSVPVSAEDELRMKGAPHDRRRIEDTGEHRVSWYQQNSDRELPEIPTPGGSPHIDGGPPPAIGSITSDAGADSEGDGG